MFNQDKFNEWEEKTHLPEKTMDVVNYVCEKLGVSISGEITISMRNRGGYLYAYAKGFSYSYCTSSYIDGPDEDYSKEIKMFVKGLGFKVANSYGDNGLDSETNWHDTFWTYEFIYEPTMVYAEDFYDYDLEDYTD